MQILCGYSWPGNIRELRNVIEASLLRASLNQHSTIQPSDLPLEITSPSDREPARGDLAGALARAELAEVEEALREFLKHLRGTGYRAVSHATSEEKIKTSWC
jgi:transcriptional regulator with PAS, ATPase and Fis domain